MKNASKPTKLDRLERVEVTSRAQLRTWLAKHHSRTEGIWLVHWKKATPAKYIGYDAIVEEALCQGWIDSLPRKLDELRTMIYLSPRKPKSVWSKVNKERVERLMAAGLIRPAGLAAIERAKANGSWTAIDAVEAMVMPDDLAKALAAVPAAQRHFDAFPQSVRKAVLQRLAGVRTAATRSKRIAETVRLAAQNQRPGAS
ncbi:MAG: YdeI/OmpD-associated family protein [Flavobacteriales bacterium]|nr:YdeI/OmpD-associated family protein [Flavobacteriales bacterium]